MATLREVLNDMPLEMRLNDGGTTWTVDSLLDALDDEDEVGADYVLGGTTDGRTTIERLDAQGYRMSPPAYVEVRPEIEVLGLGADNWTDGADHELERYGTVTVRIGGVTYEVGATIDRTGARYECADDWAAAPASDGSTGVPADLSGDVIAAINDAAPRMWREAQA